MRKSSKLLAVLLTLCLLFGAITAIFASADGEAAAPVLNVGDHFVDEGANSNNKTWTGNSNRGHVSRTLADASGIKYKYFVFDADFYMTGTSSFALQLANLNFTYTNAAGTAQSNKSATGLDITSVSMADGAYSLKFGGATAVIPNISGMYNHFTYVMKVESNTADTTTTYTLTCSVYLNGKYIASDVGTIATKTGTDFKFVRFGTKFSAGDDNPWLGTYGGVTDASKACTYTQANGAFNYFAPDSVKTVEFEKALANNADLNATANSATVYNANYVAPAVNYVKIGNATYSVPTEALDALSKIETGAEITLSGVKIANFDVPNGVKGFEVELLNGASFDLSDMSEICFVEDNGTYTYSKQPYIVKDDLNENKASFVLGTSGHTSSANLGFEYNNSAKSRYITVSRINSAYVRLHYNKNNGLYGENPISFVAGKPTHYEREAEVAWRPYAYYDEATELKNFKYFTIDFDFGADAYAYTFTVGEGETAQKYYATAASESEAIAKLQSEQGVTLPEGYTVSAPVLAYPTGLGFTPQFQSSTAGVTDNSAEFTVSSDTTSWTYKQANALLVKKDSNGNWYVHGKDDTAKASISNELGVFNHVSYVFEISVVDGKINATSHVYVNGEFLYSVEDVLKGVGLYDHFQELIINFYNNASTKFGDRMYDKYSIAFDNMAIAYYDADTLANTTLDEGMEDKAPLYTLQGVVYNENYVTPNTDKYATVGTDTTTKYYVIGAALNKLSEGGTVYFYNAEYNNFVTDLNSFTVVCDEKSEFTLDPVKNWGYYREGDSYHKVVGYKDLQASLTLTNGIPRFYFYIPYTEGLTIKETGYTFLKIQNTPVTVNGVRYIRAYWDCTTLKANDAKFVLEYAVEGKETPYTLTSSTISFSLIKYAIMIVEKYGCGSEEAQLMKAIVDYKAAFLTYKGSSTGLLADFNAVIDAHEDCTCGGVEAEGSYINVATETTDKSGNAVASFATSGNFFALKVIGNVGDTITLTYKSVNKFNTGEDATMTETIEEGTFYMFTNIEAADIDNEFTITITTPAAEEGAEPTVATYKFSLANYIAACKAAPDDAELQKVLPVVEALADYAIAAENYKVYIKNPTPAN